MIIELFQKFRSLVQRIKLSVIRKGISGRVTLEGKGHNFGLESRAYLLEGATRKNIILQDHVEMFATLCVAHNGVINMGEWSKIGPGSIIESTNKVVIGKDTAIAAHVTIRDNNSHPISPSYRRMMRHTPHGSIERSSTRAASAPIIIGENVWVGEYARICKGVTIGDNAVIAACSVVTKDVPANAVAAGNPARIVKENIDQLPEPIFN